MKIRDREVKQNVEVRCRDCPKYECYWPRPDPGVFTPGVGYRQRTGKVGWLCGNREIRGCPNEPKMKVASVESQGQKARQGG
jgi:hypothetical protein